MNSKQQRIQRHAFWHSYWLVHHLSGANNGLLEGLSSDEIKRAFDRCHDDFWVRAKAKKAMKSATNAAWKVWQLARRKNPESLSSVNFFKTKEASRLLLQKGAPICRGQLKIFFKELSEIARA
jgi:hypothetical protein